MAKLFISMSGEGRGHATRVRSLVERMRDRHKITLFAPGEAYEFLAKSYEDDTEIRLVRIPGLKFHYRNKRLHLWKTIFEGLKFQQVTAPKVIRSLVAEIEREQPDVILTDFEPTLPRAARRCKQPFLSLTHQHFLVAYDLTWLPKKLQFFAWFIGLAVPLHYTRQKVTMISSFFKADLLPKWQRKGAISLGPMIRPEVRGKAISAGIPVEGADEIASDASHAAGSLPPGEPFLLSYLRKQTPDSVVDELVNSDQRIKIYGLGEREPRKQVTFHAIDPEKFVDDLVACRAVVSAAGNQLLGECMYLGKPVMALPETWHHEQLINAHFLRRMGCGDFETLETFRTQNLLDFLEKVEEYRTNIEQTCLGVDGTATAISVVEAEASSQAAAASLQPT